MHPNVIDEARKLDRMIDLPMWMSTLSLEDKALPFYKQREIECAFLESRVCASTASTAVSRTTEPRLKLDKTASSEKSAANKK